MLEVFDQAHGLQAYAGVAPPSRLLPVPAMGAVSHRLLWLLARRLARQGEAVVVLDGMADEGEVPGLAGLLAGGGEGRLLAAAETLPGVHIVPARQGLLRLANQASLTGAPPLLDRLGRFLPEGSHLLLTASADVLAVCLQGTAARPLVALDGQPRSLVEAYNTVKVLLQAGELRPVLVPMTPLSTRGAGASLDAPVQALAHCARTHLGEDLQIWPVAYDEQLGTPGERVPEAWWFKVLDSALVASAAPSIDGGPLPQTATLEPESRRS
jgi:hypothetical protein